MILERVLNKNFDLELPRELLEKANLRGRVSIIVEENEITIRKAAEPVAVLDKLVGLGKGVFDKDSVALQKELRGEWKL